MSRKRIRSLACCPDTTPSVASCLAMSVMARVLTTPYTSHTTSHAQWRFHRFFCRSTNAQPRLIWRRTVIRGAGAGTGMGARRSVIDGHLLLIVFHAASGDLHEDVFHVDVVDRPPGRNLGA